MKARGELFGAYALLFNFNFLSDIVLLMNCRNGSLGCFWMGHGNTSVSLSYDSHNSSMPLFSLTYHV